MLGSLQSRNTGQKTKRIFLALAGLGIIGVLGLAGSGASHNIRTQDKPKTAPEVKAEHTTLEKAQPLPETQTSTETVEIPFDTTEVDDPNIEKGKKIIKTAGVKGIKTLTYQQIVTNGEISEKVLIREEVTTKPIPQITAVGTKIAAAANCDHNYSGCVPIASDVDCAGGSGNGPAYAKGPITVIGSDIYDLDRDGDGIACE